MSAAFASPGKGKERDVEIGFDYFAPACDTREARAQWRQRDLLFACCGSLQVQLAKKHLKTRIGVERIQE